MQYFSDNTRASAYLCTIREPPVTCLQSQLGMNSYDEEKQKRNARSTTSSITIGFFLKKTFIFYFYVICFVTAHGNRNCRRVLYNTLLINFTFKCPQRRTRSSGGYAVLRPSLLCFGLCPKCSDDVERLHRVFFQT